MAKGIIENTYIISSKITKFICFLVTAISPKQTCILKRMEYMQLRVIDNTSWEWLQIKKGKC